MKKLEGIWKELKNLEGICLPQKLVSIDEAWKGWQGPRREPAQLEQVAQGLLRLSFGYLQHQRPHNPSEQSVPVLAYTRLGAHQDLQGRL